MTYECFGAGQQISQITFSGKDWRSDPQISGLMFQLFLNMCKLYTLLWYLSEAASLRAAAPLENIIERSIREIRTLTLNSPDSLVKLNLSAHWSDKIRLLKHVSQLVREEIRLELKLPSIKERSSPADFFGKDLRSKEFHCAELRGACLIAANLENSVLIGTDFMGADFRDLNLNGADLSGSLFLTQPQINAAKGNRHTKLPAFLSRPSHWK